MALVDILKSRKREEVKPERLPKGALKQIEKPAKKREEIKIAAPKKKKETKRIKKEEISKEESKVKIKQSTLAAELLNNRILRSNPIFWRRKTFILSALTLAQIRF